MIADPLWSCVMLLCGPLWSFAVLCGPLWSFAVFSHTRSCGILTALQVRTVFGRFKAALLPHCVQRAGIFLNLIYDILCTLSYRITHQQTERYYSTHV